MRDFGIQFKKHYKRDVIEARIRHFWAYCSKKGADFKLEFSDMKDGGFHAHFWGEANGNDFRDLWMNYKELNKQEA
jgi:hypothetical protein